MRLPLVQGAYMARGVIANAQQCINLVPEPNTQDAPFPMTHYPAPGLLVAADYTGQLTGTARGLYMTSNGRPIAVIGTAVIRMLTASGESPAQYTLLGTLPSNTGVPVSMVDNQTELVIVDGSAGGWRVPLNQIDTAGSMTAISDPAFFGSSRVDFIDTFLIFNRPGTPGWYSSISNAVVPFNGLYFANKEGWNDYVVAVAALHDNVWVLGNTTTEIWFNAGGPTFPFARMPNSILQQGVISPYSVAVADNAVYWLSQDRWGRAMLIRGEGYSTKRVSTYAVEDEWSQYPTLSDAIGMTYQLGGHQTIGIYFPSGSAWWAYDTSTQLFHKRTYNGTTTPWLPSCMMGWGHVQGITVDVPLTMAGDRSAPRIFQLRRDAYTDAGVAITRLRSWMHTVNDGRRQSYPRFAAAFDGHALTPDTINLTWSDDGARSYGTPVPQTVGNAVNGQYLWRRLGYGRDRVFRLDWSGTGEFALNGAWIDAIPMAT